MKSSENILIYCILCGLIIIGIIGISLTPNSPRIIITKSKRPSFRIAEVEPNEINSPVRESLGFFVVTAYCHCPKCCGKWSDRITASGHHIQKGDKFCASDSMIPFGKKLDIPGYGFVSILDRGRVIKGRKLDVFFFTHEEALEWGNQELEIHCWVEGE